MEINSPIGEGYILWPVTTVEMNGALICAFAPALKSLFEKVLQASSPPAVSQAPGAVVTAAHIPDLQMAPHHQRTGEQLTPNWRQY